MTVKCPEQIRPVKEIFIRIDVSGDRQNIRKTDVPVYIFNLLRSTAQEHRRVQGTDRSSGNSPDWDTQLAYGFPDTDFVSTFCTAAGKYEPPFCSLLFLLIAFQHFIKNTAIPHIHKPFRF